jgi:fumarate hydratase subunit beta
VTTSWLRLEAPLTEESVLRLHAGDHVCINGTVYVARDAAHKRLIEALSQGHALPFDAAGQMIYYMGPTPARPGQPIGSAGPTTSYRMDPYTEPLLRAGVKGFIGKGQRSEAVYRALRQHKAIYLIAVGGAGALIAQSIRRAEVIAYPELGPEALRCLDVVDLPVIVGYDVYGQDVYTIGQASYRRSI